MFLPTILKHKGVELPELDGDSRIVIAENGLFLERNTPMFSTSIRLPRGQLGLDDHYQHCRLTCAKIPRVMHRAMLGFFKYAYEVHGGEAALVLLYNPDRNLFRRHCPVQTVEIRETHSGGFYALDYIEFDHPFELPDGYLHFGDAHLHPGSPHPSSTDLDDDQDGLHIIVGHIDSRGGPEYHVDFVIDDTRFRVPSERIFEDPHCDPYPRPPERWLRQIRLKKKQKTHSDWGLGIGDWGLGRDRRSLISRRM